MILKLKHRRLWWFSKDKERLIAALPDKVNLLGNMTHAILAAVMKGWILLYILNLIGQQPFHLNYETDFTGIFYTCTRLSNEKSDNSVF